MRAFISGGCGQVGSHIAEILLARGDEVLSIDNLLPVDMNALNKNA